jgi:hypothetical protein
MQNFLVSTETEKLKKNFDLNFKGNPLRSKTLKTQNLNFIHRSAEAHKTERYAKNNLEIYKLKSAFYIPSLILVIFHN